MHNGVPLRNGTTSPHQSFKVCVVDLRGYFDALISFRSLLAAGSHA